MDLGKNRGMIVDELKSFLRLRGLKVTGVKDELVQESSLPSRITCRS